MEHRCTNSDSEPFFDLLSSNNLSSTNLNLGLSHCKLSGGDMNEFSGDDALPNYDFQPIRSSGSMNSATVINSPSSGAWLEEGAMSSGRHRHVPAVVGPAVGFMAVKGEPSELCPDGLRREIDMDVCNLAVVSAVENTMKKYADNLLRVLEGITGQLSQLEVTTHALEHLLVELKATVGNNYGEADGKLRVLNNHLLEVHRTVQLLRDKQEIAEAQAELVKLQTSKDGISGKNSIIEPALEDQLQAKPEDPTLQVQRQQQRLPSLQTLPATLSQSQAPQLHSPPAVSKAEPTITESNISHQSSLPSSSYGVLQLPVYYTENTQMQLPAQQVQVPQLPVQQPLPPHTEIQQSLPPHTQGVHQPMPLQAHFQLPMVQQALLQQPLPQQAHIQQRIHQPPGQAQSIQPLTSPQMQAQQTPGGQSHLLTMHLQPVSQGPFQQYTHQTERPSYGPLRPQSQVPPPSGSYSTQQSPYIPSNYAAPLQQLLPSGPLAPQQQHAVPQTFDSSLQRSNPSPPAQIIYNSQNVASSGGYGNPIYRVVQPVTSFPSGYTQVASVQPVSSGLSPGRFSQAVPLTGGNSQVNRVPVDEIAEKIAAMGFSRDQAKTVMQKLTENGQPVDLNIVLDRLMNGGINDQHQRVWYGQ
eukprot:c25215_g1_i2 orf=257-2173(-)